MMGVVEIIITEFLLKVISISRLSFCLCLSEVTETGDSKVYRPFFVTWITIRNYSDVKKIMYYK